MNGESKMIYLTADSLIDKSCNSVYKLVIMAAKRGLEIAEGKPKLVPADSSVKPSTVAIYEIAAGKIHCRKLPAN